MSRLVDLLPVSDDIKRQLQEIENRLSASDTKDKAKLILKQRKIILGVK